MFRSLLLLILAWSIHFSGSAQDYLYEHFGENNGMLLSPDTYRCIQDKTGFLWFATASGASRFDGSEFKTFTHEHGLPDNEVIGLYCDRQNRVWFESLSGKMSFYHNGKIFSSKQFPFLKEAKLSTPTFTTYVDDSLNIWAGTFFEAVKINLEKGVVERFDSIPAVDIWEYKDNIYFYSPHQATLYNPLSKSYFRFPSCEGDNTIPSPGRIAELSEQEFIFSKKKSLFQINLETNTCKSYSYFNNIDKSDISKPFVTKEYIFALTRRGCFRFKKNEPTKVEHLLINLEVTDVIEDHEGNFWFCTNHGIYLLRDEKIINLFGDNKNYQLVNSNENILVATDEQGYSTLFDKRNPDAINTIRLAHVPRSTAFYNDDILFGSNSGVQMIVNGQYKNLMARSSIKEIVINKESISFIESKGIRSIPNKLLELKSEITKQKWGKLGITFFPSPRPFSATAHDNKLLIGTEKGLYHLEDDKLNQVFSDSLFQGDRIVGICPIGNSIYFGMEIEGVYKADFHLNPNSIKHVTDVDFEIVKLLNFNGQLMIFGKKGGFVLDGNKMVEIKQLSNLKAIINDATIFEEQLIVATSQGVLSLTPNLKYTQEAKPISSIDIKTLDNLTLENEILLQRDLLFEFNTKTYSKIVLNHQYKIDDQVHWTSIGLQSSAVQRNISPGKHTIYYQAVDSDGQSYGVHQKSFSIKYKFWEKGLFKFISLLLFLILGYLLFSTISSKKRKKLNLKHQAELKLLEARDSALRAQMNPHFIFNALNSIANLIVQEKTEEAFKYLGTFSNLVRFILKSSRSTSIKLKNEISFLNLYLEIESLRFSNKFNYKIESNCSKSNKRVIPSMVIQPFIENAILHGLMPSSKNNLELNIRFDADDQHYIICTVEDNGVGRKYHTDKKATETEDSLGIKMIEERLLLFQSKQKSSYHIHDLYLNGTPTGTKVILKLAYESNHY